jgi:5-methylcytosine-specific restriction endonuclease McrA
MKCQHLTQRSNKRIGYKNTLYCRLNREWLPKCNECQNKSYKPQKPLKKAPIKKVSKNKVYVSSKTYNEVLNRDKKCVLCSKPIDLQLHHVLTRGMSRLNINNPKICVMLCYSCHQKATNRTIKKRLKDYLVNVYQVRNFDELVIKKE